MTRVVTATPAMARAPRAGDRVGAEAARAEDLDADPVHRAPESITEEGTPALTHDAAARLARPVRGGGGGGGLWARGSTDLFVASGWGDLAIVRALIAAGADPNSCTDDHETALMLSPSSARCSPPARIPTWSAYAMS